MIHVIVSYRVKPPFVAQNKLNIAKFLKNFEDLDQNKFNYRVFFHPDDQTFTHISHYENADMQHEILNEPSFVDFQKQRDDSGLDGSHKVQVLEYIGSAGKLI